MKTAVVVAMAIITVMPSMAQQREKPRVYIEAAQTVDASNSKDKAKQVDFGTALAAALVKKEVPVTVVTDKSKANWDNPERIFSKGRQYWHEGCEDCPF